MKTKWTRGLPVLIKDMMRYGRIHEETFEALGYPIDTDGSGKEYPARLQPNIIDSGSQ